MTAEDTDHPAGRFRVALLGCGRIARLAHLSILRDHPTARLVAVADTDIESRDYASRHAPKAEVFDDFSRLLGETRPDGVVIALPTLLHREAAVASFEAGAHVYLEKPVAHSLDDATAIFSAWRGTRLVARMGFNARFNRLYQGLKAALLRGDVGLPVAVRFAFTARFPGEGTWRISPSTGGGALLELASHHVDLMRFVFDSEIVSVSARTWSNRGDDESAMAELVLSNGTHVQCLVSYGTVEEDRMELYGTEGKLTVDRYDSLIVERTGPLARGGLASSFARARSEIRAIRHGLEKRKSPGQEPSFSASLDAFLRAAHDGRHEKPDLADGIRALEVVDAARRSASDRCTIELS